MGMSDETVKLQINIQINTEGEMDTGMSVEEWNALTDKDRSVLIDDIWRVEASSNDGGGVSVLTPGAEEA